ncbi:MAG TPA: hypothetical protein VFJ05_01485 [Nitrososphaeraceae archaeon]|nr:hypothetical protein [Nitrososphaeraceae archaeon]
MRGKLQQMSKRKQQQKIEWRRSQVLELSSKGHSQSEIATIYLRYYSKLEYYMENT